MLDKEGCFADHHAISVSHRGSCVFRFFVDVSVLNGINFTLKVTGPEVDRNYVVPDHVLN